MIITVAGFKGGTGKTCTATHLSSLLNSQAPTLLVDADPNKSALEWSQRGELGFPVLDERAAFKAAKKYEHVVIDTAARPEESEVKAIAEGCDLLIIPTSPDALAIAANTKMLPVIAGSNYKILLTIVPPPPNLSGVETLESLKAANLPVFNTVIRRFEAFKKAALAGVTVDRVRSDRNARIAARCYQQVMEEILNG